jgi:hypothetical protein
MTERDKINVERQTVDTLLDNGMVFKAGFLRFRVRQPYLGTLLHMSKIFMEIALDEEKLKDSAYAGSFMLVPENAKRVSRLVAIIILNSKWKIKLFTPFLAHYLLWKVTPSKLFSIMGMVMVMSNTASFTNSIRLIHTLRVTKPKEDLIE